jgi:hypothetical protein
VEKHKTSGAEPKLETNIPLSAISRRVFLAEAAATIALTPTLLRASFREPNKPAVLHLATSSHTGHIHTFALTSRGCSLLGSTAIDTFAAFAAHPLLPILYVARDCEHWNGLPRGIVETYAVNHHARPLQLLAQTPMALSATGPRSLAVSSCGRHLLVSASTGGAWNSFALDADGMPAPVAIARKETGIAQNSRDVLLPAPHGVTFSPCTLLAVGTDLGNHRLSLLEPSSEGIAVHDRSRAPSGLAATQPVWTPDGRYILAVAVQNPSLLLYEVKGTPGAGYKPRIQRLNVFPTATPITVLLAHPAMPIVFTSRMQGSGSLLESWEIQGDRLQHTNSMPLPGHMLALAHDGSRLWAASRDRLVRISTQGRDATFETRLRSDGVRAVAIQNLPI